MSEGTTPTLRTLLDARAADLPGRDRERAALVALAEDQQPLVAIVHGIAGVGKSALLRAAVHDARAHGATAVLLDGRAIEPTELGFLNALGTALGEHLHSVGEAAAALAALPGRVVLLVDAYERLPLLDFWMRVVLVPALPASVRLVLAGRDVPIAWTREFGDHVRLLRLGNLERDAARKLLARAGIADGARADAIDRVVRGHPMALQLAAAAQPDGGTMTPALEELAGRYLEGLDSRTRRALEAACVVRRATIPLLAAMVPDQPPTEAFAALQALPFAEVGPDGLLVDDAVREATAALLRATDPVTYRHHRVAAWRQLRRELRDAAPADFWRYTADMLHFVEHPVVRDAFFPSGAERYVVEPARGDDGDTIASIAAAHLPPAAAERLLAYWAAAPGTFRVSRDSDGAVAAFASIFELEDVSGALLTGDPVAAAWREHRRLAPMPRGQRALHVRHELSRESGTSPSVASAALWLDIKRDYLELRPALRRVYIAATDVATLAPALAPLGFAPLADDPLVVDGVGVVILLNDMGPASVDGWLGDVVGRELQAAEDGVLDAARRRLVLDGRDVDLTRLEFDVLRYLQEHEGRAVEREALLRDVWGYDWTGGSNVVEVVVSALRRKLGERAGALETVRGVGYRLQRLA
ncbi:winged helix-turn-helix domain-containing protein [Solirubrobacter ginsenosidimutans]|uniref:Winged helix-turn-helix domain-containing protein n=1 Tax=Solirubrobacter ginsenosidimutans TaxID=490573 RepID=A0A9X3S190_9ACTN|nr:winged helix-turn-helix domain-containing protein [Solirubrobacter ginsenosidimutans]MDA0160802.1 winged helix-turn-helix domain-containing protein [Solirubrobacter ginsenosidimutans]